MLYREIFAVCSEIYAKHTNSPCGQKVAFLVLNLVVHIVIYAILNDVSVLLTMLQT
jgi:hypothetical protein